MKPSVTEIVRGMPPAQQGRAKALHQRGVAEGLLRAASELEKLLATANKEADEAGYPHGLISRQHIESWVRIIREALKEEES